MIRTRWPGALSLPGSPGRLGFRIPSGIFMMETARSRTRAVQGGTDTAGEIDRRQEDWRGAPPGCWALKRQGSCRAKSGDTLIRA